MFSNGIPNISFGKILGGISKTLGFVNQIIPIYNQAKPMINNSKKILNILKNLDIPKKTEMNTNAKILDNKKTDSATNLPVFFS